MKVAVIGHGMFAETHLRAITGSDIVKFQGLLGRDFERAESYLKASVAEEKVYRSISELCNDCEIDFRDIDYPSKRPDAFSAASGTGGHSGSYGETY